MLKNFVLITVTGMILSFQGCINNNGYRRNLAKNWTLVYTELKAKNPRWNGKYKLQGKSLDLCNKTRTSKINTHLKRSCISDISPLKGYNIEFLNLNLSDVSDLTPLKGMKLRKLCLSKTKVNDKNLVVLKGMPLEYLDLNSCQRLSTVLSLKGLPLKTLELGMTNVSCIEPLRGMPLERLYLYKTKVINIDALKGMPIKRLWLNDTKIKSLKPLKGMSVIVKCPDGKTREFKPGTAPVLLTGEMY